MTAPAARAAAGEPDYFGALDGLRLLSCVFVVIGHTVRSSPFAAKLGGTGVNIFFALSGFLITTLLLRERARYGNVSLGKFYLRRILRIFPVYYTALFLFTVLGLAVGKKFFAIFGYTSPLPWGSVLGTHVLFLANWYGDALPTCISVLWSVSVEEQFYLVFPPLLALRGATGKVYPIAAVALVGAVLTRVYLADRNPGEMYLNTLAHADHLVFGVLFAQILQDHGQRVRSALRAMGTAGEVVALTSVLGLTAWEAYGTPTGAPLVAYYSVNALMCTLLVGLVAVSAGGLSRVFSLGALRKLGQMTYAGYVFHMYAVAASWTLVAKVMKGHPLEIAVRTAVAVVFTFVIAYATRVTFEQRILSLKDRLGARSPAAPRAPSALPELPPAGPRTRRERPAFRPTEERP